MQGRLFMRQRLLGVADWLPLVAPTPQTPNRLGTLSLCGCGSFYGTTRLALKAVAFWVQVVVQRLTRCGSDHFMHTPT